MFVCNGNIRSAINARLKQKKLEPKKQVVDTPELPLITLQASDTIFIGSKPLSGLDFNNIIDKFQNNIRTNMDILLGNNNGTKYDQLYMNSHVHSNLLNKRNFDGFIKQYSQKSEKGVLQEIWKAFDKNKFKKIHRQKWINKNKANDALKKIGCPVVFNKGPRVGHEAIVSTAQNTKDRLFVFGCTVHKNSDIILNRYHHQDRDTTSRVHHDPDNEVDILHWLHEHNHIDITFCLLKNKKIPTLDCQGVRPTLCSINMLIREFGIIVLENYFNNAFIDSISDECLKLLVSQKDEIQKRHEMGCCGTGDILHLQKLSGAIKRYTNEELFNNVVKLYKAPRSKKILIDHKTHDPNTISNVTTDWHKNDRHCQFKSIMYLTDTSEQNGNFQWITNSSPRHIDIPGSKLSTYTVDSIVNNNDSCEFVDVTGKKGTIIIADTSYVHRNNIIHSGERVAITQNYFSG